MTQREMMHMAKTLGARTGMDADATMRGRVVETPSRRELEQVWADVGGEMVRVVTGDLFDLSEIETHDLD